MKAPQQMTKIRFTKDCLLGRRGEERDVLHSLGWQLVLRGYAIFINSRSRNARAWSSTDRK